jgi:hypothetical protein
MQRVNLVHTAGPENWASHVRACRLSLSRCNRVSGHNATYTIPAATLTNIRTDSEAMVEGGPADEKAIVHQDAMDRWERSDARRHFGALPTMAVIAHSMVPPSMNRPVCAH